MSRQDDLDRQWRETGYEELGISFGAPREDSPAQHREETSCGPLGVSLLVLAIGAVVLAVIRLVM